MSESRSIKQHIDAVLVYIDHHLAEDIELEQLSRIAHFSKFHFHRLFRYAVGIPVFEYIKLKRLTRASHELAIYPERPITEIAISSGYENSESFSRAFKNTFQQTPSQFRTNPYSEVWTERTRLPQLTGYIDMQVQIVDFPITKVALLVHKGSEATVMQTVHRFISWRRANGFSPQNSETYGIFYSDPRSLVTEEETYGVCGTVTEDISDNEFGVVNSALPAGRCAVVRQIGNPNNVEASVRYLYSEWLPNNDEELRDFPCFVHRVSLASQVPETEAITDVYLPLK